MYRPFSAAIAAIMLITACTSPSVAPTAAPSPSAVPTSASATQAPGTQPSATTPIGDTALIPQPEPPAGLEVAPDGARVDLHMPTFSNPTVVDNPLFPVSSQESVLMLGTVSGKPFRTEVTLLPEHRIITWGDLQIEALVSQYNAYLDGRIEEVAYDYYAQDDAGNVWYLGEDVFDFVDGRISSTHGTWLAGRDAPGAMIMPADPQVGDVYRTENAPPLVFEEVTVKSVGETLDGPLGPLAGGIVVTELHSDGTTEDKQFAPGYGEFYTSDGHDLEALALAVPTDRLATPVPEAVAILTGEALQLMEVARNEDWAAAATSVANIGGSWEAIPRSETPSSLRDVMDGWLADLSAALDARDGSALARAAIETARSAFDIQLRHRPAFEIDLARMDLWAAELKVDAADGNEAGVNADMFAIDYVRDRVRGALNDPDMSAIDGILEELTVTVADGDLAAAAEVATSLREALAGIGN